jgi:hypothetical protein
MKKIEKVFLFVGILGVIMFSLGVFLQVGPELKKNGGIVGGIGMILFFTGFTTYLIYLTLSHEWREKKGLDAVNHYLVLFLIIPFFACFGLSATILTIIDLSYYLPEKYLLLRQLTHTVTWAPISPGMWCVFAIWEVVATASLLFGGGKKKEEE